MKVHEVMGATPVTVGPEAPVAEVARAMLAADLPGIPVVDATGDVLGVITERDLVHKHASLHLPRYLGFLGSVIPLETRRTEEDFRHILAVTARQLMSTSYRSVDAETEIDDAAAEMVEREVDLLLVFRDDALAGLVSTRDIIRLLVLEDADDSSSDRD